MKCIYLGVAGTIFLSGCGGWLMPYKEDFSCQLGAGEGYCGSVIENYNRVQKKSDDLKDNNSTGFNSNIFDKTVDKDVLQAMWLKQRANEKNNK